MQMEMSTRIKEAIPEVIGKIEELVSSIEDFN
jgi:hypothetical protein